MAPTEVGLFLILIGAGIIAALNIRTATGWIACGIVILDVVMLLHVGPFH